VPEFDAPEVLRRLGGIGDWQQLRRYSTAHSARQALATGAIERIARGRYALPEAPPAQRAAAAMGGLVSHRAAADHWLMERLTTEQIAEVVVPRGSRPRPRKGVVLHYADVPAQDDHDGVTSPLRTVLDCAALLPFAEALAIADSALRRGLVDGDQLVAAASERAGRGRQKMLTVAQAADGAAANPFESGLRAIVLDAGLTDFQPQLPVRTPGLLARVDLGDPVRRIALEADSYTFHGTRQALVRDCDRYDELVRAGWLVLRFTWEHVMFEPDWVASVITDTCALRNPAQRRSR
jgi:very-short-patch-repair endonuclease